MKIIKRNGSEQEFNPSKIHVAMTKAFRSVEEGKTVSEETIANLTAKAMAKVQEIPHTPNVEEVQDIVENVLMDSGFHDVSRSYIKYRFTHAVRRNTTDAAILSLIEAENEEVKQENANKNPTVASVQRDYMAGEVSKDLTMRLLLPEEIAKAHNEGILHFHDADYYAQHMHNCCLINLDDMLQNGTVISGTMIEKPHRFSTACNIATQIIAQVASCQYGGQSISLTHLAKFVDVSRKAIRKEVETENKEAAINMTECQMNEVVERRLRKEIRAGIQTIQYQIITLMTTNGQAPFVTVFMYLDEAGNDETLKHDLAICIEEMLKQRYEGVKNEVGVWITPAFPKLIYVLDEDNIRPESPFFYLTKLAAKCTAKRMVPDYISAKKMREYKLSKGETEDHGDVYTCMGCVTGDEVVVYKYLGTMYTESFERMWRRLSAHFPVETQPGRTNDLYIDLHGVSIYDNKLSDFTECHRIIRNENSKILRLKFSNGRVLDCTPDHPFETENRGVVRADELASDDVIMADKKSAFVFSEDGVVPYNTDLAWALGLLLCDASYDGTIVLSLANEGEDDIAQKFSNVMKTTYGLNTNCVVQSRERKGVYKDILCVSDGKRTIQKVCDFLVGEFGGKKKMLRHIPSEVFTWDEDARFAFLAGMIDADGYINNSQRVPAVQIGSINKELAIQQALLAQSLGMPASIYMNHYKGEGRGDTIRYHVTFVPCSRLMEFIVCDKKKAHFNDEVRKNHSISETSYCKMAERMELSGEYATYDVTTASEHFMVSGLYSHNCRSFLTPDRSGNGWNNIANAKNYEPGEPKYYGRFNQGVVTINLPDVALSSGGDFEKFWQIFDERLELCHKALQYRHKRLEGTLSDTSPIHWQYGALARLQKGEPIDKLLHGGYSTISLGYAGLYECCKYMTGKSHTDPEAKPFALKVMQHMNDMCAKWKAEEDIDYSLYGTPLESTTYKFAKCLDRRFGKEWYKISGGKNYITNSYHVHVTEQIDAFTKLKFESEFQKLSPGGAISYVEVPNMQDNLAAVIKVMQFIYDNIMYAELNTKSDYCQVCGYDGEIQIVDDDGKLVWECPNCHNRDFSKMNVARRTCGYIGCQGFNAGRTAEIRDRVLHL